MDRKPIAWVWFTDRSRRPVYEEPDGRQFVIDDDGEKAHGVWYIPTEECALPLIVDTDRRPPKSPNGHHS